MSELEQLRRELVAHDFDYFNELLKLRITIHEYLLVLDDLRKLERTH